MGKEHATVEQLKELQRQWQPMAEHLERLQWDALMRLAAADTIDQVKRIQGELDAYANLKQAPQLLIERRRAQLEAKRNE